MDNEILNRCYCILKIKLNILKCVGIDVICVVDLCSHSVLCPNIDTFYFTYLSVIARV
jgi:hypothetical protein